MLAALAGVYFISTASLSVGLQRFRDVIGAMNVAFLAFLLSGVGVRLAFPLVSLEGEAVWLLRTAPRRHDSSPRASSARLMLSAASVHAAPDSR